MAKKEIEQRQLNNYFTYYSAKTPTLNDKIIQGICSVCAFFSLLGISWFIPFPHFNFLGQYNSYFNWASFIIALSIYYYSKLSPILSYLMLFLTLIFTYIISILEKHYSNNYFFSLLLYIVIFVVCEIISYTKYKKACKNYTTKMELLFILIGPIWLLHFLLKKWSIKY